MNDKLVTLTLAFTADAISKMGEAQNWCEDTHLEKYIKLSWINRYQQFLRDLAVFSMRHDDIAHDEFNFLFPKHSPITGEFHQAVTEAKRENVQ